jgi:hypothetical protein
MGGAFMDNDLQCFDRRGASTSSLARFGGVEEKPVPAACPFEGIGCAAADPSLQISLRHEPKAALCAGPDR